MKRISLFILMCLLACVGAWAFDVDGISYDILSQSERTACVGRQTDTERVVGDVVIPRQVEYQGTVYTVTEISGWAFSNCRQMISILMRKISWRDMR